LRDFLSRLNKASNLHDLQSLKSFYSKDFKSADGFSREIFFKMVEETFKAYTDISYSTKVKSIEVYDNWAVVMLYDNVEGNLESPATLKTGYKVGKLAGFCDYILYLRKENEEWKIISDCIIAEETTLKYGDANDIKIELESPLHIENGQEYTISLKMECPKNVFALASLDREVISYPPNKPEEAFRKLPQDGLLERIVSSSGNKDLNEYAIASIGLTRLFFEDEEGISKAGFEMSGLALVMKRVNVGL
jgi:hypothetical protein